jgi:hypothetical protein
MQFVINPELMTLLEKNDVLDVLKDSVAYQMQKIYNVEKTNEGRDWYKSDYGHLFRIFELEQEQMKNEMNKGYYYWRLLLSACNTYRNDLVECDQQLNQEFNLKVTEAISDNVTLNECIGVLDKHVVEN